MFVVKLGTGKTVNASGVDEQYNPATEFSEERYTLTFEANPAEMTIEEYREMLFEEGALASIEVSVEGETVAEYTGYEKVDTLYIRLLPTGDRNASISLTKGV